MSRWYILTWLVVAVGSPVTSWGQTYPAPGYPPTGNFGGYEDSATQAGYWHSPGSVSKRAAPKGYPAATQPGPARTIYEELPDDQGWLYDEPPIDRVLNNIFRHAYLRVDYLLWDISDPGNTFLGSPSNLTVTLDNPLIQVPVPVSERPVIETTDIFGNQILAVQPSLAGIFTNENNGIRMTFGFPVFNAGTWETSVFSLATSSATYTAPDLRAVDINGDGQTVLADGELGIFNVDLNGDGLLAFDELVSRNLISAVVQAVMVDGVVPAGDNFLLVNGIDTNITDIDGDGIPDIGDGVLDDPAYSAVLRTSVFGAESNFLLAPYNPNQDLTFSPLLGIRYLNFYEQLNQTGRYEVLRVDPITQVPVDPVDGVPVSDEFTRRINAATRNNLYGPQIGVRGELRKKWFAIGATPKVMLGLNSYRANLETSQVLGPDDPSQSLVDKGNTFGVIADLEVFSRIYLGQHVSVFAGYNFMWAGMITRPADDIVYNIRSATTNTPTQSNFDIDVGFSGAILQGVSVGGQIEY